MRTGADRRLTRALAGPLAVLLLACSGGVPGARLEVQPLVVGNERITAELAWTPEDRRRGLMHRESMPEDHGMLFIFPEEKMLSFWMKNTPLPLSIAFADAGGRIVSIADLEPNSETVVSSRKPASYALEMNRGWFARHGVLTGDSIGRIPTRPAE